MESTITNSLILYGALLALIALERVVELRISKRNAAAILQQGGSEHGQGHFPVMVLLHTAIFPACFLEAWLLERPWRVGLGIAMALLIALTMALRYWAIRSLGPHWNTRVIVLPDAKIVSKGPYQWIRHPNYLAVIIELAAMPLFHGAWITMTTFGVANLFLLKHRIQVEEKALETHCDDLNHLSDKNRFLPR